jgi:Chain length determinant protein
MKLIPLLKELSRHKRWVVIGPILAALIVVAIAKKAPSAPRYTATEQILVDSTDSSVPDASKNLATLIPRAGIYAQIMTNAGVMDLIGKAAGIPGDEIAASGPANTFGQTASHPATVASGGDYALALTLPNSAQQPIISIAATATTRAKAIALANGGATGLNEYVNQLASTYAVPAKHRITIRGLGAPSVSVADAGIPKLLLPLIFLFGVAAWCMLVIFVARFIRAWRTSDSAISHPFPSEYDAALLEGAALGSNSHRSDAAHVAARNGDSEQSRWSDPAVVPHDKVVPMWPEDELDQTPSSDAGSSSFASDLFLSRQIR